MESSTKVPQTTENHIFALCGLIISLMAFSLAATYPWILDTFAPKNDISIEEAATEMAFKIKDHITAKITGAEVKPDTPKETDVISHWTDHLILTIIISGLIGAICGIIAYVRHEHKRMSLMAALMGFAAIITAYAWIVFAVVIFLILVGMVLDQLDFISF